MTAGERVLLYGYPIVNIVAGVALWVMGIVWDLGWGAVLTSWCGTSLLLSAVDDFRDVRAIR